MSVERLRWGGDRQVRIEGPIFDQQPFDSSEFAIRRRDQYVSAKACLRRNPQVVGPKGQS